VLPENLTAARALGPFSERQFFGKHVLFYDGGDRRALGRLGEVSVPQISDLFVARTQGGAL
jgi:hypothetical protein